MNANEGFRTIENSDGTKTIVDVAGPCVTQRCGEGGVVWHEYREEGTGYRYAARCPRSLTAEQSARLNAARADETKRPEEMFP
jgi:hypothetical protein